MNDNKTPRDSSSNYGRTDTVKTGTDANRDPISGTPGAHPVGAGLGAAGAGAAGAAIGAVVGGPIGAVVGAVAGGIAGGLGGKAAAETVNPTNEDAYWRTEYTKRPYAKGATYEEYKPAYEYGWSSYDKYRSEGKRFDEVEPDLKRGWDTHARNRTSLDWERAKVATKDAWHRVEHALPGDADRDGR